MFTPTGYQPQTLSEIITDINNIFIDVFGAGVNLNAASPNGQFINQLANVAVNNQNFMVLLTSSLYNPDVAQSVWLDALAAFNGIKRLPATYSTVTCTCAGSAGLLIPAGTQISNTSGDVFANIADATIGGDGTIDTVFQAISSGPIAVLAGTVNNIINKIYGWDTVINAVDGVEGQDIESDNNFRDDRTQLLAFYGSAALGSIYAAVYEISGVTDVNCQENDTASPITIQGVTLPANAIYVAVIGGAAQSIAQAMYQKKCPGIPMVGNTTTNYTDPVWGNVFAATYQRPVDTPVRVDVSIQNSSALPADIITQVKNAIVNNFNGEDPNVPSMTAVSIGQIINVSRFVPSLIAIGAWDILSMTIQLKTGGTPGPQVQLNIDLIATLATADVHVTLV